MRTILITCLLFLTAATRAQQGAPDGSFGQAGRFSFAFNGDSHLHDPTSMAVQPDGKIVVTGFAFHVPGATISHVGVARLLANGSLDPAFSGDGKAGFVVDATATNNAARVVRILADGKILMFVTAGARYYFLRLKSNGDPDETFGNNGVVRIFSTLESLTGFTSNFQMQIQSNGKILLAYRIKYTGLNSAAQIVSRFLADGSPDTGFAGTGRVAVDSSSTANGLTGPIENVQMSLVAGNKILLAGDTVLQGSPFASRIKLIQLAVNGSFDAGFGSNGQLKVANISLLVNAMQIDALQNIYLAGMQGGTNTIVKLKSNGALDGDYGTGGLATGGTDFIIVNNCMTLQNGVVVIGGISNAFQAFCKSFDAQGKLNTAFGTGGVAAIPFAGVENVVRAMTLQPDGKLLLADRRKNSADVPDTDFEIIRLNALTTAAPEVTGATFNIFPNPASDAVEVRFDQAYGRPFFRLFDPEGRQVVMLPELESAARIPLAGLSSGRYTASLQWPDRKPVSRVLFINR